MAAKATTYATRRSAPAPRPPGGTPIEAKWTDAGPFERARVSPFFLDKLRIAIDFADGRTRGYLLADQGKTWRLIRTS